LVKGGKTLSSFTIFQDIETKKREISTFLGNWELCFKNSRGVLHLGKGRTILLDLSFGFRKEELSGAQDESQKGWLLRIEKLGSNTAGYLVGTVAFHWGRLARILAGKNQISSSPSVMQGHITRSGRRYGCLRRSRFNGG